MLEVDWVGSVASGSCFGLKGYLHLFAVFQPVTPNIPGWAEPIEPGLGELHSGSDEEHFWLPSHFVKQDKSHWI